MDGSGMNMTRINFNISMSLLRQDWKPLTMPLSLSITVSKNSCVIVKSTNQTPVTNKK